MWHVFAALLFAQQLRSFSAIIWSTPIIETRFETVCDFVPLEDEERANESVRAGRGPLLPEYFDPYQPLVDDFKLSYRDILEIVVYGHDGLRDGRNPQSFPVASCGC